MIRLQAGRRSGLRWPAADMPDQTGRTAVINGATNGIGLEIACMLATRGAALAVSEDLTGVSYQLRLRPDLP